MFKFNFQLRQRQDAGPGWFSRRRNKFLEWRAKRKAKAAEKGLVKEIIEAVLEGVESAEDVGIMKPVVGTGYGEERVSLQTGNSFDVAETEKGVESDSDIPTFGCENASVPGEIPMKADIETTIGISRI
jgi:hypothetical protein